MMDIPFLCDGEIIGLADFSGDVSPCALYDVRVSFRDNTETIVTSVPVSNMVGGGIGDYSQIIRRGYQADDKNKDPESPDKDSVSGRIGDRVLLAFVNGDPRRPLIIGFQSHPNQSMDFADPDRPEAPQMIEQFLGMNLAVNPDGEMTMTHYGAPAVAYEQPEKPEDWPETGAHEYEARSSEEGLPVDAFSPQIPIKAQEFIDNTITPPLENDSLAFPNEHYHTQQGFLKKGEWFITDSESQTIFTDPDSKTITITNGDDAIQIDKANKKIFFKSSGDMEFVVEKDSVCNIGGEKNETVVGDVKEHVQGDIWETLDGNRKNVTKGNHEQKITGNWSLESTGEFVKMQMKSGNMLYLDDREGKEGVFLVHKTGAQITLSSKGDIVLIGKDGSNISIQSKGLIVIQPSKGGLISIDDKILMSDKTGKQMIVVSDSNVEINASKQVTLSCKSVSLNCGDIALGANATMSSVVGENLVQWLSTHIHGTGTGPSSPALIQPATLTGTPLDILSKYVKIKANI